MPKDPEAKPTPGKRPELLPARSGSAVSMMRAQIEEAKGYVAPPQFERVQPPTDAPKVKFELSNGDSFVIALMREQAPAHVESFLALAAEGYWKDMAVDEIQRPSEQLPFPRQMHLGYASTRADDRTKWITTEPSEHILDFEKNSLSHFPGAVSGNNEADGKSCADRFYVVADDAAMDDGGRVIFGYVVEGLDSIRDITAESMTAQEEQAGRGRPATTIRVTAVSVL
jgi:cyclophilin family peptidyl-prolyl cis-trans isomerase